MRWLLQLVTTDADQHLPASPYVRDLEAPDYECVDYALPGSAAWSDLPLSRLGLLQGLVLTSDVAVQIRLYRQTDGYLTVSAGGRLVLWRTAIRLDTLAPVEVRYSTKTVGAVAHIRALAIGIGHEAPP